MVQKEWDSGGGSVPFTTTTTVILLTGPTGHYQLMAMMALGTAIDRIVIILDHHLMMEWETGPNHVGGGTRSPNIYQSIK